MRRRNSVLEPTNLKGNINSIETIKKRYTLIGNQLMMDNSYDQDRKTITTYSGDGIQLSVSTYDSLDEMTFNLTWHIDRIGTRVGKKVCCYDGSLLSESSYHYMENGNIIEKIDGGVIVYKYISRGFLIEELWYEPDGQLQNKYTYEYDKNENRIEWIHHDDLVLSKITYQYDDMRNVIEEGLYDANGNLFEERKYEYDFDSNGNWIIKVEHLSEEILPASKTITNRIIKYQ